MHFTGPSFDNVCGVLCHSASICAFDRSLVSHLLARAKECYVPSVSSSHALPQKRAVADSRILLDHLSPPPAGMRAPDQWSQEESFLRTGVWCTTALYANQGLGFQKSVLGGSHACRALHKYHADACSYGTSSEQACTKHKEVKKHLLPGTVIGWCHDCEKCLFFAVMTNPESPRSVFDILYTMLPKAPRIVIYDNACNLMHFCLNREPQYFQRTIFLVDAMHFKDHRKCCDDFDAAKYMAIFRTKRNTSLAEQKNAVLRKLENSLSFMTQCNFLLFLRHWIHRMNSLVISE